MFLTHSTQRSPRHHWTVGVQIPVTEAPERVQRDFNADIRYFRHVETQHVAADGSRERWTLVTA